MEGINRVISDNTSQEESLKIVKMEFWLRLGCFVQNLIYFMIRPIFNFINGGKGESVRASKNLLLKLTAVTLAEKIRRGEVRSLCLGSCTFCTLSIGSVTGTIEKVYQLEAKRTDLIFTPDSYGVNTVFNTVFPLIPKTITSQTVVEAYIQRIREVNPLLNAVVEDRFEAAIQDAKSCDVTLKTGGITIIQLEKEKPLFGVPFTVKESCSLKDLSLTGCTLVRQNQKALSDSAIVESMKNAGAIPLCVTNTPELCSGFNSANLLFGQTNNPYDSKCTPGGSSGGEGALLGAGASLIGIGSDIAGSIRVPGLWNGIFGHKPTPGIISIKGHYPISANETFQKYLVLGPLARYAQDLIMAVKVMSWQCTRDLGFDKPVDMTKLKVYYLEDAGKSLGLIETDEEIRSSIRRGAKYLSSLGSTVKKSPIGSLVETCEIVTSSFFGMKDMPKILMDPDDPKNEKNALVEGVKGMFGLSRYTKSTIFVKLLSDVNGFIPESNMKMYEAAGERLREKFLDMLGNDGVFLYPTFPTAAPLQKLAVLRTIGGMYCLLANVFGCPATHVPMGLNKDGLPIGFQVIAAPYQDRLCLAVAQQLENGFGGWIPPPSTF